MPLQGWVSVLQISWYAPMRWASHSLNLYMALTCLGLIIRLEVKSCLLFWGLRDVDVWVLIKQKLHHDGDDDGVMERSTKDEVQWKKTLQLWCVLLLMSLAYSMFQVEPLCWCSFSLQASPMFLICCSSSELKCFGVLVAHYYKCFFLCNCQKHEKSWFQYNLISSLKSSWFQEDSTSFDFWFLVWC
jgi:hypothetical protein